MVLLSDKSASDWDQRTINRLERILGSTHESIAKFRKDQKISREEKEELVELLEMYPSVASNRQERRYQLHIDRKVNQRQDQLKSLIGADKMLKGISVLQSGFGEATNLTKKFASSVGIRASGNQNEGKAEENQFEQVKKSVDQQLENTNKLIDCLFLQNEHEIPAEFRK